MSEALEPWPWDECFVRWEKAAEEFCQDYKTKGAKP